jgi:hypothetical protein
LIGPHERSITRPEQKFGIDQSSEQRIARYAVEAPQPLCLGHGQTQTRHLDVFALDAPKDILLRLLLWWHTCSLCFSK